MISFHIWNTCLLAGWRVLRTLPFDRDLYLQTHSAMIKLLQYSTSFLCCKVRPVLKGFFHSLAQMISNMRGYDARNDL